MEEVGEAEAEVCVELIDDWKSLKSKFVKTFASRLPFSSALLCKLLILNSFLTKVSISKDESKFDTVEFRISSKSLKV